MNKRIHMKALLAGTVIALGTTAAHAATISLPLTGLRTGAYIQNYFNGGNDSVPTDGPGPALGFTFSANAEAEAAATSSSARNGGFENNPSLNSEILYFANSSSTPAYMNFATGFSSLSFNYSMSGNSASDNGTAYLYSGLNGTGTLLGTIALNANGSAAGCAKTYDSYCTWYSVSAGNFGVAESVVFAANNLSGTPTATGSPTILTEFDGVKVSPVPLPGAAWLLFSGVAGLAGVVRRRKASA